MINRTVPFTRLNSTHPPAARILFVSSIKFKQKYVKLLISMHLLSVKKHLILIRMQKSFSFPLIYIEAFTSFDRIVSEKVNGPIRIVYRSNVDSSVDIITGAYHRINELITVDRQKDIEILTTLNGTISSP